MQMSLGNTVDTVTDEQEDVCRRKCPDSSLQWVEGMNGVTLLTGWLFRYLQHSSLCNRATQVFNVLVYRSSLVKVIWIVIFFIIPQEKDLFSLTAGFRES